MSLFIYTSHSLSLSFVCSYSNKSSTDVFRSPEKGGESGMPSSTDTEKDCQCVLS